MFLGIQDFDFCPNLIKFFPIYPNLPKSYPNFTQIGLNFAQICQKKFARGCGRIPSSYATAHKFDCSGASIA